MRILVDENIPNISVMEYSDGTSAEVDGRFYPASEFPHLIENWCSNKSIRATRDFALRRGNRTLFGFHDHPSRVVGFRRRDAVRPAARSGAAPSLPRPSRGAVMVQSFPLISRLFFRHAPSIP